MNDKTYFIKLSFHGLESVITKSINPNNYQVEFIRIFNLLQEKYQNEELSYILNEYVMYIYTENEEIDYLVTGDVETTTVEFCKLSLIEINKDLFD